MSSVTFLMVLCKRRDNCSGASASLLGKMLSDENSRRGRAKFCFAKFGGKEFSDESFCPSTHTRSKNLRIPKIPRGSHGYDPTSLYGPINARYIRTVSLPSFLTYSSGSTTLPRDFDIFCPSGPKIIPRFMRFVYGSSQPTN